MPLTLLAHVLRLLALALASLPPTQARASSYSAYTTSVNGSARHVGLSGATVAMPDGYAGAFVNPAGYSGINETGIDFGFDSNGIDDFVVDLSNPKSKALNVPLKYSYAGARFAGEDGWGIGIVKQTPYSLDQTFLNNSVTRKPRSGPAVNAQSLDETILESNQYTVAAAKAFLDKQLAIGVAINFNQVREAFNFQPNSPSSATVHLDKANTAPSIDVGLLARPVDWLQLGFMYKMGYRVPFDENGLNAQLNGNLPTAVDFFRDVRIPHRFSAGLAWIPNNWFRFFAQTNYVPPTSDSVLMGSGLFPSTAGPIVTDGRSSTLDGHWGMEYIAVDSDDLTVKFWAGGYIENTRLQGGYKRYHRTAGLQFAPWFLSIAAAVDDAEYYNNFSIGLGVDMLQVASRVAKTYGWKLPI